MLEQLAKYSAIAAIALLFVGSQGIRLPIEGWTLKPAHFFILLAAGLTLPGIFKTRLAASEKRLLLKSGAYVGLMIIALAAGSLISWLKAGPLPEATVKDYARLAIAIILFFVILRCGLQDRAFIQKCNDAFLGALVVVPLIYFSPIVKALGLANEAFRIRGLFSDPGTFGNFMIIPAGIAFQKLLEAGSRVKKLASFGLLVTALVALAGSGSWGSMLGAAIAFALLAKNKIALAPDKRRAFLKIIGALALAMILAYIFLPKSYNRFVPTDNKRPTAITYEPYRLSIWRQDVEYLKKNPLGYGLGYQYIVNIRADSFTHLSAHNMLFEFLLAGGPVLLGLALWLAYLLFRNWRAYPELAAIFSGVLFSWLFLSDLNRLWIWALASLAVASFFNSYRHENR